MILARLTPPLCALLLVTACPALRAQSGGFHLFKSHPRVEAATAVNQTPDSAPAPASGNALRPGDTVEVRIANVPPDDVAQFSAPYTIDDSGNLNLPFIGNVKAGGVVASQLQLDIQKKLIDAGIYTNPTVSVNPPAGTRLLSVSGAVRAPARIPYTSDLTVMSAINAAGGPSDFAGDKIRLTRGGKVEFFSRKKLYKDPSLDPRVQPGDQIEIVQSIW